MYRVGQNHIYTVCIRYFWQENHQIYSHMRCMFTVLANPSYVCACPYFCSMPLGVCLDTPNTCCRRPPHTHSFSTHTHTSTLLYALTYLPSFTHSCIHPWHAHIYPPLRTHISTLLHALTFPPSFTHSHIHPPSHTHIWMIHQVLCVCISTCMM